MCVTLNLLSLQLVRALDENWKIGRSESRSSTEHQAWWNSTQAVRVKYAGCGVHRAWFQQQANHCTKSLPQHTVLCCNAQCLALIAQSIVLSCAHCTHFLTLDPQCTTLCSCYLNTTLCDTLHTSVSINHLCPSPLTLFVPAHTHYHCSSSSPLFTNNTFFNALSCSIHCTQHHQPCSHPTTPQPCNTFVDTIHLCPFCSTLQHHSQHHPPLSLLTSSAFVLSAPPCYTFVDITSLCYPRSTMWHFCQHYLPLSFMFPCSLSLPHSLHLLSLFCY